MKLTFRIWLLIIVLALSLLAIFGMPPTIFQKGVMITSVEANSTAFEQGLRKDQVITAIDGEAVSSVEEFTAALSERYPSEQGAKTIFTTDMGEVIVFSNEAPQITITELSKTQIKLGLDLSGGARALIRAEDKELTAAEMNDLVEITRNRFNEFGLTDIKVLPISDLAGNRFMMIEIAGATPKDMQTLVSEQGKFEAKIGNDSVFLGGKDQGIASVSRSGQDTGVYSCDQSSENEWFCNFRFGIFLTEEAAKRHADITGELEVNVTPQGNYLTEKLDLYLDDKLVDSLLISEGLKGRVTTQIQISGSATGQDRQEAVNNAFAEMKQLQTVLITGSLPYKLEIVKLDTISPTLGKEFINTILLAGIAAILAVALVVLFRYRKWKSSLALIITSVSEIIIILGVASLINWNLDLPSIAGILATIGTGIDSQIIVLDETRQGLSLSLKQRLKRAFGIILGAYFTAVAAMIPLYWAVAGLFKGFAVTTIIGITIGVLFTRPAFSDMIQKIEE